MYTLSITNKNFIAQLRELILVYYCMCILSDPAKCTQLYIAMNILISTSFQKFIVEIHIFAIGVLYYYCRNPDDLW